MATADVGMVVGMVLRDVVMGMRVGMDLVVGMRTCGIYVRNYRVYMYWYWHIPKSPFSILAGGLPRLPIACAPQWEITLCSMSELHL
jgi:hypothetical protein